MTMIRSLAIVTALCWCDTSASALTMEECKARYKAVQAAGTVIFWDDFQKKQCGINTKASAPTPAAPVKR